MKRIIIIAAAMLLSLCASAQSGKSIYNRFSDADDVSAVYISPAMFKLMGKLPDFDIKGGDVNVSPIVRSLEAFYLIDSRNASINAELKADAEKMARSGRYEMLMEVKDNGETVNIYTIGDENIIRNFILIASDKAECTFISLDGQIPRGELEKMIAEMAK